MRGLLGSGRFWAAFWAAWTIAWICMIPITLLTGLAGSLPYLTFLSVMALVLGCAAAFQASLGMRKADPEDPL